MKLVVLLRDVVIPSLISITPRSGFVRVLENLESPGKRLVALESFGNLFNSSKKNIKCMADSEEN